MFEFPSAAMVSNRCWSVMINKMSGLVSCMIEGVRGLSLGGASLQGVWEMSFRAKRSEVEEPR
jgi:hypothetical protein